jgi:hypothetical protein
VCLVSALGLAIILALLVSPRGPSGIKGIVAWNDPTPGLHVAEKVTIHVLKGSANGPEVSSALSDNLGHFMVEVPPGEYFVTPNGPITGKQTPNGWGTLLTVRSHTVEEVTIYLSTGLQ